MDSLLRDIRNCTICANDLLLGPNPVIQASPNSKIGIIGQAPGSKVHQTGIAWDDPSGKRLREWLQVSDKEFYDSDLFALVPMGFCYPGRGKTGDNPPRPECAPTWHQLLLNSMPDLALILLIGGYSQSYYLNDKRTLTQRVKNFESIEAPYFPLPHPSPRNNIWLKKNVWFEEHVLPELRRRITLFK